MKRSPFQLFMLLCGAVLIVVLCAGNFGAGRMAAQTTDAKAAEILKAALEAAGGGSFAKIESMEMTTRREAFMQGNNRGQSDGDIRLIYPQQMWMQVNVVEAQTVGGGAFSPSGGPVTPMQPTEHTVFGVAEGCDGALWWRKTPGSMLDRPFSKAMQLRIDLVGALGIYKAAAEGKLDTKYVADGEIEGHKVQVLALNGTDVKFYFDPQTHLLAGASYPGSIGDGTFDAYHWWAEFMKITFSPSGVEQIVWWSDYKRSKFKVDGKEEAIQFPMTWTTTSAGSKFLQEKVKSLKLNSKVNAKLFAKPKS